MAITQGEIPFPFEMQPDRRIIDNTDGTLDGSVEFWTKDIWENFLPNVGDSHPDDRRLECHTREKTAATHNRIYCVCHYKGLRTDPTDPTISYVGTPNRELIQTHPDFADFGGSAKTPNKANGAVFDSDGVFRGFTKAGSDLYGVEYYLTPSTQVTLTHWQTRVPTVERMVIVKPSKLRPFRAPDDAKNFLLIDTPYRQIGSLYQVSKLYLGSGENGWSTTLYPQ